MSEKTSQTGVGMHLSGAPATGPTGMKARGALEPSQRTAPDLGSGGPRPGWFAWYRRWALLADVLAALLAGLAGLVSSLGAGSFGLRLVIAAILPMVWVAALALNHGYEQRFLGTTSAEFSAVVRSSIGIFVGIAFVSYVLRFQVARGVVLVILPALLVCGLVGRHVLRRRLRRRRASGLDLQPTVIIGDTRTVEPMIRKLQTGTSAGMHVVAACVSGLQGADGRSTSILGVPVFGYPEDAMSVVDFFGAEVVAVSSDPELHGIALRRLAWSLEERGVELVLAPGLFEVAGPRLSIRPGEGMPLLHVERPVMSGARRVVKTAVDRLLTVGLAVAVLPLLILIAAAVRCDSPGPVLFRQRRVGARGEEFLMYKFRTMCVDAEAKREALVQAADAGNAVLFKMKADPRITRVGRLLRRFSLDELPQLINVVLGDMSLIGPRPSLPREVAQYEPDAVRRLRVRPGLTGLWQVSGRSDLSWDESLRLDLWYVDNWSLMLDLRILAKTARAVVRGAGAY